jgi:pyruvate-formate lyase
MEWIWIDLWELNRSSCPRNASSALATDAPSAFSQALQLLLSSNFADLKDCPGDAASFGGIDQLLMPFLPSRQANDISDGEKR